MGKKLKKEIRVLSFGWYGAGNVGDELLLETLKDWCQEIGASLSALSINPAHTRTTHQIEAIDAYDLPAVARAMQNNDLFVLGGGGLFQTHHSFTIPALYSYAQADISAYARPVLMAKQMGLPTLLWAQGVGPLEGDDARQIVSNLFSEATYVSVRDENSRSLLNYIGVNRDITVAPDPVWAYPVPARNNQVDKGTKRIALVLRPWAFVVGWEERFVEVLKESFPSEGYTLVWMPFQAIDVPSRSESDTPFIKNLIQQLGGQYTHELVECTTGSQVAQAIANCDSVVSMRLHAQILALKMGKPTLCIEYDPKMGVVSTDAGVPTTMRLTPDVPIAIWRNAFQALVGHGQSAEVASHQVKSLSGQALAHRDVLERAINSVNRTLSSNWQAGNFDWLASWADGLAHQLWSQRDSAIASFNLDLNERNNQIIKLNQSLVVSADQNAILHQTVADSADQIAILHQTVADSADQIAILHQTVADSADQITILHQTVTDSANQNAILHQTITDSANQNAILHQTVTESTDQIATLNQTLINRDQLLASANADYHSINSQIIELKKSTSWVLTRPLRFLKRFIQLLVGNAENRHNFAKSIYWLLPQFLRIWLNPLRHKIGAQRLSRLIEAAPTTSIEIAEVDKPEWLILANNAKKILIIPCSFEFEELVNQRPINAAKYFSSEGYFVIFIAWQWTPIDKLIKGENFVYEHVFQVPLFNFLQHASGLTSRTDDNSIYMVTFPAEALIKPASTLRSKGIKIVYDIMDEWECFSKVGQAPWFNLDLESKLVLESDFVTTVSPPLQHKFQSLRNDIVVVGNGYSTETINKNSKFIAKRESSAQKTVGYFGHLTDSWFDWPLLFQAAERLPDVVFEIIGYGEPEWVQRKAQTTPNIKMLGKILPSDLHKVAQHWHIGLIPFKKGDLAMAVDPIKIYEYFYFGLPVVATGIEHLDRYPCTHVSTTIEDFTAAIQSSASNSFDKEKIEIFLNQTTWSAQFGKIKTLMEKPCLANLYGN